MLSSNGVIVRSLYRACLRLSRDLTAQIESSGTTTVEKELGRISPLRINTGETLRECVQREFRVHAAWTDLDDIAVEVDNVFEVMRLATLRRQQLKEERDEKPQNVEFSVGQLVKHRRYGYRGVVVGWDPVCNAPEEWQEAMQVKKLKHKADQAFYHTLVDIRDRQTSQRTYMAAENVIAVNPGENVEPVQHPEVEQHFCAFDPHRGRYIANESLRQKYPDD